jgi:hydroxymethylpyrimidine/phosphomethylpyrimidine kinase
MHHNSTKRSAMNVAYTEANLQACRHAGFTVSTFDRLEEPSGRSSMEWGTEEAIKKCGQVPDIIWDCGGYGKEAMIRIIGETPDTVINKVRRLVQKHNLMEKN